MLADNFSRRPATYMLRAAALILLAAPGYASGSSNTEACPVAKSEAAEAAIDKVVRTLAHHWSWLPKLAAEIKTDPMFGRFVMMHVDSTVDYNDLREISRTATSLCPATLTELCRRLKTEATAALREPE